MIGKGQAIKVSQHAQQRIAATNIPRVLIRGVASFARRAQVVRLLVRRVDKTVQSDCSSGSNRRARLIDVDRVSDVVGASFVRKDVDDHLRPPIALARRLALVHTVRAATGKIVRRRTVKIPKPGANAVRTGVIAVPERFATSTCRDAKWKKWHDEILCC